MTDSGTVIASILADRATGATSNTNDASTTTDNTVTYDSAAPTGGSITYTDGYYATTSVNITADDGVDGGSGIDTSTRTVQRQSATLTSEVCGTYSDFATITPSGTYPNYVDSTVVSANCYIYRYQVSDNLAQQATYTSTNVVMVDTSLPTTPGTPTTTTPTSSTSQAWSWTVSTDTLSGIVSYAWRTTGTSVVTGTTVTNSANTTLSAGTYSFFVKAIDGASNEGLESEAGTLTVVASTTQSSNTTSESSPSSSDSGSSSRSCSDSAPPAPELFQADVKGNSATLFFTPLLDTNKFFISYSTNTNAEEHGVEVSLAREGVQKFTVNLLKPGDTYYFKIRGQNGCASGPWSNILIVRTGYPNALRAVSYYMNTVLTRVTAYLASPQTPKTTSVTPKVVATPAPAQPTDVVVQEFVEPAPAEIYEIKEVVAPVSTPPARMKLCFLWWCF